jgi:tetratricopeptide (TPR) repeat protein
LNRAIELDDKYAGIYSLRGLVFGELGQYQNEINDCTKAEALNPKSKITYIRCAYAHGQLGDYQNGVKECDKLIAIDAKYRQAYFSRADAYCHLGHHDAEVRDYQTMLEFAPTERDVYLAIVKAAIENCFVSIGEACRNLIFG